MIVSMAPTTYLVATSQGCPLVSAQQGGTRLSRATLSLLSLYSLSTLSLLSLSPLGSKAAAHGPHTDGGWGEWGAVAQERRRVVPADPRRARWHCHARSSIPLNGGSELPMAAATTALSGVVVHTVMRMYARLISQLIGPSSTC